MAFTVAVLVGLTVASLAAPTLSTTANTSEWSRVVVPPGPARCADLVTTGSVWGSAARGVSLGPWTGNGLTWLGCSSVLFSCKPSTFFCTDFADGLSFGTSSASGPFSAVRACHGVASLSQCLDGRDCCSQAGERCNSPDTAASATALCWALGYASGVVEAVPENVCSEVNFQDGVWKSDFLPSSGYGKSYTCTGISRASTTASPSTITVSTATTVTPTATATSATSTTTTTTPNNSLSSAADMIVLIIIVAVVGLPCITVVGGALVFAGWCCVHLAARKRQALEGSRERGPTGSSEGEGMQSDADDMEKPPEPLEKPAESLPDCGCTARGVRVVEDLRILGELERVWAAASPADLGRGRDVREPGPRPKLSVKHAWYIDAPGLFQIHKARAVMLREDVKQLVAARMLPQEGLARVRTKLDALQQLICPVDSSPPEVVLLHGTKPEHVMSIMSQGLNERLAQGLFGSGVYLAEEAAKADQYSTSLESSSSSGILQQELCDKCGIRRSGKLCFAFVCKVTLGVPLYTKDGERAISGGTPEDVLGASGRPLFVRTDKRDLNVIPETDPPVRYHSLIAEVGGRVARFREFIVFNSTAILPWLLVAYVRE